MTKSSIPYKFIFFVLMTVYLLKRIDYLLWSKSRTSSETHYHSRISLLYNRELLCNLLIFSRTHNIKYLLYKRNRASIIIFWKYENDGHVKKICPCRMHAKMPVLTVNMIFKFAPLKCIGANRNRAWIIHENEKYSLSWPKVRDLQWLSEGESYIYITVDWRLTSSS